jgi:hypothetical protein
MLRRREGIAKAGAGPLQGPSADRQEEGSDILRLKSEGVRPSEIASRLGIVGQCLSGTGQSYRREFARNGGDAPGSATTFTVHSQ